jgi:hypothetical protein
LLIKTARIKPTKLFLWWIRAYNTHKISFQDVPITTQTIAWNCCHRWLAFCGWSSDGKIHNLI